MGFEVIRVHIEETSEPGDGFAMVALHHFELVRQCPAITHRNHTLLADPLHGRRNELAQARVTIGRDRRNLYFNRRHDTPQHNTHDKYTILCERLNAYITMQKKNTYTYTGVGK